MTLARPLMLLSGYLGKSATSMLLLVAFARLSGAQGAGEFAFAMAVTYPVFVVAELALRNVFQTMHDVPPFRTFYVMRALCVLAAAALVIVLALAIDGFPAFGILLPLLVMRAADSMLDICFGGLQAEDAIGTVTAAMWVNTLLSFAVIAVALGLDLSPEACVAGSALSSLLVLVPVSVVVLRRHASHGPAAGRTDVTRILRAGVVLGAAQALGTTLVYLPAWYLAAAATTEDVGVFAVCQYVVLLSNMFFSSVQQTSLRPLRLVYASQGAEGLYRAGIRKGAKLVALGAVGAIATLLMLPALAPVVFGSEFDVSWQEALPLAVSVVVLAADYATTSFQLVLNRYVIRVVVAGAGVASALLVAAATFEVASVGTAGYVVLAGVAGRAFAGGWAAWRVRPVGTPEQVGAPT